MQQRRRFAVSIPAGAHFLCDDIAEVCRSGECPDVHQLVRLRLRGCLAYNLQNSLSVSFHKLRWQFTSKATWGTCLTNSGTGRSASNRIHSTPNSLFSRLTMHVFRFARWRSPALGRFVGIPIWEYRRIFLPAFLNSMNFYIREAMQRKPFTALKCLP